MSFKYLVNVIFLGREDTHHGLGIDKMETKRQTEKAQTANSTYKKLAVQWLNKALCFAWRDFVVADRLVLSNHQLLVAANLY